MMKWLPHPAGLYARVAGATNEQLEEVAESGDVKGALVRLVVELKASQ